VLTGVQLPDGSGLDLIRTVRAYWPRVRVGVLADREEGANAADADFLLFTPVRAEQLLARVVHGGEGAR
jgi:DNA-binding response OmpR family regulator